MEAVSAISNALSSAVLVRNDGHMHDGHMETSHMEGGHDGGHTNNSTEKHDMCKMHSSHNSGHQMFFITRLTCFHVLFEGAFIRSKGAFVGTWFLSFAFAMLTTFGSQWIRANEHVTLSRNSFIARAIVAVLHGLRQAFHYIAMLLVMTFNVWLLIAVCAGHAVGWLLYAYTLNRPLQKKVATAVQEANVNCDC